MVKYLLQVLNKILPEKEEAKEITISTEEPKQSKKEKTSSAVVIDGNKNYMIHFAKCCNPLYGDDIIGYITFGKGITIHLKSCKFISQLDPDRLIDVKWNIKEKSEKRGIKITVIASDRPGLGRDLANVISSLGFNMTELTLKRTPDGKAVGYLYPELKSNKEYELVRNKLIQIPGVINVRRTTY